MSNRPASEDLRPLGTRYRLDEPDGTWWEVGWDRPLGTFYAQHFSPEPFDPFTPDQPLDWFGTRPSELATVAALAQHVIVPIPDDVVNELRRDADAYPHSDDPPFMHVATALAVEASTKSPVLRTTLPAGPVAYALKELRRDPYLAADDLGTFARGLGLDDDLARNVVDGTVEELNVEQIAHVCEALRCSPYDLWGAQLGREILDVYGPERWPRHIEPLDGGRTVGIDDTFLRRRLERQAAEVVRLSDVPTRVEVEVTRFRQTAVLVVDADGRSERVTDTLQPADPTRDYHFAFQRIGEPETVSVRLTPVEFAAGCPAGHDATPALADVADGLDRARPGTDMFRFIEPITGTDQWLGRETPFDPWQTWDDPRRYYPGDPSDVLDEHMLDPTPALTFEGRSVDVEAELEGIGLEL